MSDINQLFKDMDPENPNAVNGNLFDSQKRQVNNKLFLAENIFKELRDDSSIFINKIHEGIHKTKQQKIYVKNMNKSPVVS